MCAGLAVLASARAEAGCVDPATLARSTVNIVRMFEAPQDSSNAGIAGTAWFLSANVLVTAAHVADAMRLSDHEWTQVQIHERERKISLLVRIRNRLGSRSEKIAVLELRTPFWGAIALPIRAAPLVADEPLLSLAYPELRLRTAGGRFVRFETEDARAGAALLELHDGDDRLALDHGASGAPVLDCNGRVVAVVTSILSQTIDIMSRKMRVSTPWQTPNVVAEPVATLGIGIPAR